MFGAHESVTLIDENLTEARGKKYSSSNPSQPIFYANINNKGVKTLKKC